MQMNEMKFFEGVPVDGYGPGFFRVAGQVVQGPICLGPTGLCAWQGYDNLDPLIAFSDVVDVVFVGTGAEIAFLPDPIMCFWRKADVWLWRHFRFNPRRKFIGATGRFDVWLKGSCFPKL